MALTPEQRSELAKKAAAARKTIANQYTATKKSDVKDTAQRDRVRAELLAQRLELHAKGRVEMSATQVAAAKVLIDKGKPSLQAIEHQEIDARDRIPESELLGQLQAIISANPGLLQQLNAIAAQQQTDGSPRLVDAA